MFGSNKKQDVPEMVPEFGTGVMLLKRTAIEKEALIEQYTYYDLYDRRSSYRKESVFFRAGTENLAWDYVKVPMYDYQGAHYFKRQADTEVNADGSAIVRAQEGCSDAPVQGTVVAGATGPIGPVVPMTIKLVKKPAKKRAKSRGK